jgi:hypothetical protein
LPFLERGVGFKSIGKAVTKGSKKIGKTLTTMADSPDKRGQGRLAQVNTPQFYNRDIRKDKAKQTKLVADGSLGLDTGKLDSHNPLLCLSLFQLA